MKLFHYQLIILLIILSGCGIILGQGWFLFQQHDNNKFLFEGTVQRILAEIEEEVAAIFQSDNGSGLNEKNIQVEKDGSFMGKVIHQDFVYPKGFVFELDSQLMDERIAHFANFIKEIKEGVRDTQFLETVAIFYQQGPNAKNRPPNGIADYVDFDSLLTTKLTHNNITIPYTAGLQMPGGNWFYLSEGADTTALLQSKFQTPILWGGEEFYIQFPQQQLYYFKKIIASLGTSLLLIIGVFASFWYALSIILKQKKLSELKNDFINNMTHEFKTPIATIAFAIANIENQKIVTQPELILQYTKIIKEENKRMNRQVEQVLNASISDKKAFELKIAAFNVHEMLNQMGDAAELKLQMVNGVLHRRLNAAKAIIEGDQFHLSNVIANLLDNAQKYSTDVPVITISSESDDQGVWIKIKDKGMGMTQEAQAKVFDKFYRVPMGNLHNIKGFGLGLSYAKAIVEQHGGKISVESKPEKGSVFKIFLPFANGINFE